MKKSILIIMAVISMSLTSCDVLMQVLNEVNSSAGLTNGEVIEGLKEALTVGATTASKTLNAKDGYFKDQAVKILLPPEANVIVENIRKVPGVGDQAMDDLVLRINRSAEDAAVEAKPIFVQAIKEMTIQDGMAILKGSNTAATDYLKSKTYSKLTASFSPKIGASLDKKLVGNVSTNKAWTDITTLYNKVAPIIGKPQVNTYLPSYVTEKALAGLFVKMAAEEQNIRANPMNYASDIIKKVFSYAKENK